MKINTNVPNITRGNGFDSVELTILMETEEDLCEMWHMFNIANDSIRNGDDNLKHQAKCSAVMYLWDAVNQFVEKFKLRR